MSRVPSRMPRFSAVSLLLIAVFGNALPAGARAAEPATFAWIEAEDYAESNFDKHWERSSMGKPDLVSGGEWLMKGVGGRHLVRECDGPLACVEGERPESGV